MKELPPRVFMFFGEAVADSPEAGYPSGEKHSLIGFARAQGIEDAAALAAEHFLDAGWTDVAFAEGQEFDLDRLEGADDDVAETCRKCLEDGASGIVFKTVVGGESESP